MKTLTLQDAATLLKMTPEGLRKKAIAGNIPGAKSGKVWVFIEEDLVDFLRSRYANSAKVTQGVIESVRRRKWRSTKEAIRGGYELVTKDTEYNNLLGLPTK